MHIHFRLKSVFRICFMCKVLRMHQRPPVSNMFESCWHNVWIMLCKVLFCWSHAVLLTLQQENYDISIKTAKSWECSCLLRYKKYRINSCKSHLSYPGYWSNLRAKFLTETITHLITRFIVIYIAPLTLSSRRPWLYRNQSIDLQSKSMDWFLYDNGPRHERNT